MWLLSLLLQILSRLASIKINNKNISARTKARMKRKCTELEAGTAKKMREEEEVGIDYTNIIPDEVLLPILVEHLEPAYTFLASQVCRRWRHAVPNRYEYLSYHAYGFTEQWVRDGNLHLLERFGDFTTVMTEQLCAIAAKRGLGFSTLRTLREMGWNMSEGMKALKVVLKKEKDTQTCLDAIQLFAPTIDPQHSGFSAVLYAAARRGGDSKQVVLELLKLTNNNSVDSHFATPLLNASLQDRDQSRPIEESLFAWLRLVGIGWDHETVNEAAVCGDVPALEWMRIHRFICQSHWPCVRSGALQMGRQNVLEWLEQHAGTNVAFDLKWHADTIHPAVLRWLVDRGIRPMEVALACIRAWDLPLLRSVLEGADCSEWDLVGTLILSGIDRPELKETFEWLMDLGVEVPSDDKIFGALAQSGRVDVLRCALDRGLICPKDCYRFIGDNTTHEQARDVCSFLIDTASLRPNLEDIQHVGKFGHLDAFQLMIACTPEPISWGTICESLAHHNQLPVLKWVCEVIQPSLSAEDREMVMRTALRYGSYDTAKWLMDRGQELPSDALSCVGDDAKRRIPIPLLQLVFTNSRGRCKDWGTEDWCDGMKREENDVLRDLMVWCLRRGYPLCKHVIKYACCPHPDGKCE